MYNFVQLWVTLRGSWEREGKGWSGAVSGKYETKYIDRVVHAQHLYHYTIITTL